MDFRGQSEIKSECNRLREYGLSGTEPVINQECMLVHEKSGRFVKLSGTAIIIDIITVSNLMVWGGFLFIQDGMADVIGERFSLLTSVRGLAIADLQTTIIFNTEEKEKKIMKKKMVAVLLTASNDGSMTAGCGRSSGIDGSDQKNSYTIGIEQFAEHGSLDNCREGFLKGLEEEGIKEGDNLKVEIKNAAADMGTAGQISDSFVSDKVDLICAIATPSAQSAYNAAMDAGHSGYLYSSYRSGCSRACSQKMGPR